MIKAAVISIIAGYFILIWLRTNAFAEYMNLFKLSGLFKLEEYNKLHKDGYDGGYVDFISEYYKDYFIVRLLICPVCLSFWVGVINCIIFEAYAYFIIAPLSLLFYTLFNKLL
jgi:hypothetical protein